MLYRKVECEHCGGTGRIITPNSRRVCPECSGRGYRFKPACDGEHHEWVVPVVVIGGSSPHDWWIPDPEQHRECRNCGRME